jgi:hypothetical protein
MLQARLTANEVETLSVLRTVGTDQALYKRTDWDNDGILEYAFPITELTAQGLTTPDIAKAHRNGYPAGAAIQDRHGYIFYDNWYYEVSQSTGVVMQQVPQDLGGSGSNALNRYGIHAWPASYNLTGRHCYAMDDKGQIWSVNVDPEVPDNPAYNYYYLLSPPAMRSAGWLPFTD